VALTGPRQPVRPACRLGGRAAFIPDGGERNLAPVVVMLS